MSRSSIARGDVVLANLPPYSTQPWLSMGVVLHHAILAQAGIRARVVRPIDPPFAVPPAAAHASLVTFSFDPTMDERMAAMERAHREAPGFFEGMVDALLSGPEEVFGLSLFRNNADVSLLVARMIKERRPSCSVVLGGPEAIDEPASLLLPWVDAVVGADAEVVLVPLFRALLDRRLWRAAGLRNVHYNPALGVRHAVALVPAPAAAPVPVIDYEPLVPLFAGEAQATVPMLLNWGCPYNCGFCSNRGIYSRFTPGSVDRVIEEMDGIVGRWRSLHAGSPAKAGDTPAPPPRITLQLSDATTNALPAQLDDLLRALKGRASRWGELPFLRGQVLFDTRITEERVRLMGEANFFSMFFGLDAADDELRKSLQKPASVAQVAAAMEVYHRGGRGGLSFGVPIGIPGETEACFAAAERFVEQALRLEGTIDTITVLPYVFSPSAQDPDLVREHRGDRRGILWRAEVPGGDPEERGRRLMRMFDRIDRRVPVNSPIPPYLALPAMLPGEDPARIEAWMDRHGREFDQMTPLHEQGRKDPGERRGSPYPVAEPTPIPPWSARAERVLQGAGRPGGWRVEGFERHPPGGDGAGLVVLFRHEGLGSRAAILIEPRDPARRAFARTRDLNVSYLRQWQGQGCGFDEALVRACLRRLVQAEAADDDARPSR